MKNKNYEYRSLKTVKPPSWIKILSNVFLSFLALLIVVLALMPWQQTSQGNGEIIAFDPNDRVQEINSTVPGRIKRWLISDGSVVKKGDPIVEIVDNDPNLIERLKRERDAIFDKYEAAKAASETAYINYKRQKDLFKQGLSARVKFEEAKIKYKKLLASESMAEANLSNAEVKLSRQETQLVKATKDGTILQVLYGSGSVFVKEGDTLATFVPDTLDNAAEIFIDGNDLPLVYPGRKVRLQFEGWPAVQLSGWPSIAVGTFGGVVKIVDPSASSSGKFRVIVVPDVGEKWPDTMYLRQGARVYGWILLNTVSLGYEFWRQFNGFPPSLENQPQDRIRNIRKTSTKQKKINNYKTIYKEEE